MTVCCLVATLSYSGAVTLLALLAFVLPAVVLVAGVTTSVGRLSTRLGAGSGLAAALVVAELVNLASGASNGPAARSTFAAAAFTALAVSAVMGTMPALFLVPVLGVIVGALGLGSGAEVAPVAVATSVVAALALAVVEAQGRRWTQRTPQALAVLLIALLVGGVATAVALESAKQLEGTPEVFDKSAVQPSIRPPHVLGHRAAHRTRHQEIHSAEQPPSRSRQSTGAVWLVIALALAACVAALGLRVVWIAVAWRRLRRRLRRGSPDEQIAGAWVWAVQRLRVAGWPISASTSADIVSEGKGLTGLPRPARRDLRQIAGATVKAVYAPPADGHDPKAAWSAADKVGRSAVESLPLGRRLGFAVQGLTSTPSRPGGLAPVTTQEHQ